jgi:hypothetical protein
MASATAIIARNPFSRTAGSSAAERRQQKTGKKLNISKSYAFPPMAIAINSVPVVFEMPDQFFTKKNWTHYYSGVFPDTPVVPSQSSAC